MTYVCKRNNILPFALLAVLAAAAGCSSNSGDMNRALSQSSDTRFMVIEDFDNGAPTTNEPKRTVEVSDQARYEMEAADYKITNPTAVNFISSRVLIVDAGAKPTGGHSVEILDAFTDSGSIIVQVDFVAPGEGCAVTQAFTQPVKFVLIRSRAEVMVNETMRRDESCESR